MSEALPPLAVYLHLPWCVSKCPYCDFNSHTLGKAASLDEYAAALAVDLAAEARHVGDRTVQTVFIGGGTPSLFTPPQIASIIAMLQRTLAVEPDAEITLEANPGTVECGSLAGYREAGVNRLSLGVQSFNADSLKRLGRIHGPEEAVAACEQARRAGFDSINVDLMFALPGQTEAMGLADVDTAVSLGVEHVSYYQLTLEPNTVFHARPPAGLPNDDEAFVLQEASFERLESRGYRRYEVSAFCLPGHACRHNLNYWEFGDYVGVGAGAHGKLTDAEGRIWRTRKAAHPAAYLKEVASGAASRSAMPVSGEDARFEFMLNALRLSDGFSLRRFSDRTGQAPERLLPELIAAERDGLMIRGDAGRWRASGRGARFLNDLQARFLPPPAGERRAVSPPPGGR